MLYEAAALSTLLSMAAEAGTSDSEKSLAHTIRQRDNRRIGLTTRIYFTQK
jgi:hypothetical protein